MATEVTPVPRDMTGEWANKGLKAGALGLVSITVIGVASTAPGYSLAASLGLVAAAVGLQSPAIMLVAFLPMLFIAAAYFYLNRADPDCGTTFTWATRAVGPSLGWMAGWGIVMTDLVVMPSLSQIAGKYTFTFFGADGLANSVPWVTFVGVIWIVVMTAICVIGIELSARTQVALLSAELVTLALFAFVALIKVYGNSVKGALHPHLAWLNPFDIGSTSALATGVLAAVFIYWGWDTAVTVNEESKDSNRTPGVAAVLSTLILVSIYIIVTVAAQAFHGPDFLSKNSADVLSALGKDVMGSPWDKLLILAVLSSASASTQTTILPAARSALSMAVHRAAPTKFAEIHPRFLTPAFSTMFFGAVSIVWYIVLTLISSDVLGDSILALGFGIAFYYAITGFACTIYYRRQIFKSAKNFLLIGLAPLLGALGLTWAFFKSLFVYSDPANSTTGKTSWFNWVSFDFKVWHFHFFANGLGPPLVIGLGLLLIGIPLMLLWRVGHPEFFKRGLEVADSVDGPAPPLTPGVTLVVD
jgi:amino acid transporter